MCFLNDYEDDIDSRGIDYYGLRFIGAFIWRRLLLALGCYNQWLCVKPIAVPDTPKPKTIAQIEQEYSNKYLTKFLDFASRPTETKNANIERNLISKYLAY
jgi:hypothetical protein